MTGEYWSRDLTVTPLSNWPVAVTPVGLVDGQTDGHTTQRPAKSIMNRKRLAIWSYRCDVCRMEVFGII